MNHKLVHETRPAGGDEASIVGTLLLHGWATSVALSYALFEQAMGSSLYVLGLVIEDRPSDLSCTYEVPYVHVHVHNRQKDRWRHKTSAHLRGKSDSLRLMR